jgi:hypothetical protein
MRIKIKPFKRNVMSSQVANPCSRVPEEII